MKNNNLKNKLATTGAIITVAGLCIGGFFLNKDKIELYKLQNNPAALSDKVVSMSMYSSGILFPNEHDGNISKYCDFEQGLRFTEWMKKSCKIIDGEYLSNELEKRKVDYAIIDDQFYTKNGENLVAVTAEKIYDAEKIDEGNGKFHYLALYGGTLDGDKAILRETLYILENSDLQLPAGYTLISVDEIISTKTYSELDGKDICSEGKEIILK